MSWEWMAMDLRSTGQQISTPRQEARGLADSWLPGGRNPRVIWAQSVPRGLASTYGELALPRGVGDGPGQQAALRSSMPVMASPRLTGAWSARLAASRSILRSRPSLGACRHLVPWPLTSAGMGRATVQPCHWV